MKGFNQNVNTGNTLSSSKMFRSSGALRVLITGDKMFRSSGALRVLITGDMANFK